MSRAHFSGKAETLAALAGKIKAATVLPQVTVARKAWSKDPASILKDITETRWPGQPVIVRSSAKQEDQENESLAGKYLSIGNVVGPTALGMAVDRVFASYGEDIGANIDDDAIVFIQPHVAEITMSGVAFGCDPNTGGPYIVINYEEQGDSTSITSGQSKSARTLYHWSGEQKHPSGPLGEVVALTLELSEYFGTSQIDLEFGFCKNQGLCLFQVRPLRVTAPLIDLARHRTILTAIAKKIENGSRPHPYLSGDRTIYGVMPDWNPAEIIGIRPRPLALSLYRNLVTDQVWAYQRNNYGYKNLRSFPLMMSFHGLPYIDVRVSFNSFVPDSIERGLADRLVNIYMQRLAAAPSLHDKVEFEIVYSCYTLDLDRRIRLLKDYGLGDADIATLRDSLRHLTNNVIHSERGLWKTDAAKIEDLNTRRRTILDANLDPATRIYWLLEDCKRWGTLPFAGLARAGFIAMQMLRSMVSIGILDEVQYNQFLASTNTVTSHMIRDMAEMTRPVFLEKYGHLRPGTYDILSKRYDETPDLYLGAETSSHAGTSDAGEFRLSLAQMKALTDQLSANGLEMDVVGLFDFIRAAVQGREYAKFTFTRSLSDALSLFTRWGADLGFAAEELSYADIRVLEDCVASSMDPADILKRMIAEGRAHHAETRSVALPPLITSAEQIWSFDLPATDPNFITQNTAEGHTCTADSPRDMLKGGIMFIQNADPGYDWIFTHGIKGLVTAYGGVNSHMAIRAGEKGIPAVIGAGQQLYDAWIKHRRLRVDCSNRRVEIMP